MRHVVSRVTLVSAVIVLGAAGASIAGVASATSPRLAGALRPARVLRPNAHVGSPGKVHLKFVVQVSKLSATGPPPGKADDPGTDGQPPGSGQPNTTGVVRLTPAKVAGGRASSSGGPARTPASVHSRLAVVKTFAGESEGDPPDTNLAANTDDVVEFVNQNAEVWSHAGTKLASFTLNSLFDFGGPQNGCGDGRVVYDAASGEFFASYLGHCSPHGGPSEVDLAVSRDPSKVWSIYKVSAEPILQDQPKIGFSSDKVVLGWNVAHGAGQVVAIQKAGLVAGAASVPDDFWGPDISRKGVDPAVQLSSGKTAYALYHDPGAGSVGLLTYHGDPGVSPAVYYTEKDFSIPATAVAPWAVQPSVGKSTMVLDTEDDRVQEAVWSNNQFFAGLDDYCKYSTDTKGRACMRIFHIDTATSVMVQDVDVTLVGGYVYFPGLTIDRGGNLWISYTSSSAKQTASSEISEVVGGHFGSSIGGYVYFTGPGSVSGCSGYATNPDQRWGDYSGISVDPGQNDRGVWAATEYGKAGCHTGTEIGAFHS